MVWMKYLENLINHRFPGKESTAMRIQSNECLRDKVHIPDVLESYYITKRDL